MLVDIVTDPLLQASFLDRDLPGIYYDVFRKYAIHQNRLYRYAARRGAKDKVLQYIEL